jgi:uncharacterized protein (TIGR02271 family)
MLVAVFDDSLQAEQAVTALERAGFRRDQIELARQGAAPTGGFLAEFKSLFTGQETATGGAYDELVRLGIPAEDARYYQREYEAGHNIVAVMDESRQQEARPILVRYGGYGPSKASPEAIDAASTASATAQETGADLEERRLKLRAERLQAYTRPVQVGEVRLRKEVVAEQQTLDVPVTHEEVYIECHPLQGQVSEVPIGEGETIRVPVQKEQVQTSKQTVETGEIALGKRQVEETQRVSETVRHEEARLERRGEVDIQSNEDV